MTNHIEEMMKAAGLECSTPFTPKKQLELIKLLFKAVPTKLNPYFEPVKNSDKWRYTHTDLTFEEALAEMIYNALPVLDKAEVKRILEDD